jgi:hypothetical protein
MFYGQFCALFYGQFCAYVFNDAIGWSVKIHWCFIGTALRSDGNILQMDVLHCKEDLFIFMQITPGYFKFLPLVEFNVA